MFKKIFLALSCAVVAACEPVTHTMIKMGEPSYQTQGKLPVRMPVNFNQVGAEFSTEFIIPKDDLYAIYLLFHGFNLDTQNENEKKLNELLFNSLEKTNYEPNDNPILPNENIHFVIEILDTETGKRVILQDSKMKQDINLSWRSGIDNIHFAHIERQNMSRFTLKKGRYRLILKNKNAASAYQAYPISLQISKPRTYK